jgi:signal transduction histidine kinase/ActR/RegA family two-component response regulator
MTPDSASRPEDSALGLQGLTAPIIERAPLPMVEAEGPQHIICSVNSAFCRLLQKPRAELIGKPFGKIVRNGDACTALLDKVYATGDFVTHIDPDHSDDAASYWIYAMWPALGADNKPERVVIQLTRSAHAEADDLAAINQALLISGLRQHELHEVAEKSNLRSQDEIAERRLVEAALRQANEQLRAATREAQRANQAKDEFLAALSHELRTPLTPVLLAAAALREDRRLDADVREQLGMIERNVTLEARLIDDLLDLTRISHGKLQMRPAPCDAHSLIDLAVDIVRDEARDKAIHLERRFTATRTRLTADPARFQQVIWNLLRNAVKFTPDGGRITLSTYDRGSPEDGSCLRIEVSDTGIGISSASLEKIFQPFDQGCLTGDHRYGGLGLGLAIARAVVLMHGGRLTAESAGLNLGATFVVELPGATEPPSAGTDSATPFGGGRPGHRNTTGKLRLLVVEDHASTLHALVQLLRRDGHEVTAASSVAEALNEAQRHTFDLVLSDLGLPDGTGLELMETLRTRHGLSGIALSGYGTEDDIHRARSAGFATHLTKPVAVGDLRHALERLTGDASRAGI